MAARRREGNRVNDSLAHIRARQRRRMVVQKDRERNARRQQILLDEWQTGCPCCGLDGCYYDCIRR